jgi:hypothetical protein
MVFTGENFEGSGEMERLTARKWYRWLWLSPLLTIPTLLIIYFNLASFSYDLFCSNGWESCIYDHQTRYKWSGIIAILGSGLWHLVLLIPALNKQRRFVSWHGRQEMILAAVRTVLPLVMFASWTDDGALFSILFMVPIWFFGTLWGQRQAARGDCSLMRWTDRADSLSGPPAEEDEEGISELPTESLESTFRFSNDPQERQAALEEMKNRGLVEFE